MIAAQHTPGPWKSDGDNIICGPNGEIVCADGSGAFIAIPNDANARLIAAAPELLWATKLMWANLMEGKPITFEDEERIEAAIAKATGVLG